MVAFGFDSKNVDLKDVGCALLDHNFVFGRFNNNWGSYGFWSSSSISERHLKNGGAPLQKEEMKGTWKPFSHFSKVKQI